LEPRLLLSADLNVLDDGGLNDYFDHVQIQLDADVFAAPVPLIGTQLAETQAGKIAGKISTALQNFIIVPASGTTPTVDDVKTGLATSLGSLIKNGQIADTTNQQNTEYRFSLTLADSELEYIDFDLALGPEPIINPQLGIDNEVLLSFDWEFDLSFGVFEDVATSNSFFFVDTSFGDELTLDNVSAVLDGGADGELNAKGTAGIFGALIQEDEGHPAIPGTIFDPPVPAVPARPSQFTGSYDINVIGTSNKTLRNDIANLTVDAVLTGDADINLDIDAAMIPDFADVSSSDRVFNFAVEADVNISQSFVNANTQAAEFGNPIDIDYEDVRLDLGTFFSEFVDPFVKGLQIGLSPIKPIVDVLSFPIPVLSDIGAAIGLGKITPIDLGITYTALDPNLTKVEKDKRIEGLQKTKFVVEFLDLFFDLGPIAEGVPPDSTADIPSFKVQLTSFGKEDTGPDPDPEDTKPKLVRQDASTNLLAEAENETPKTKKFFSTVAGNLSFPFLLEPTLVRDMLLGDTTPELAKFGIDFNANYFISKISIPIIPPFLNADFKVELAAALDFDAGFDLFGVNALTQSLDFTSDAALEQSVDDNIHRLKDGFFFDDHIGTAAPADLQDGVFDPTKPTEGDNPELRFKFKISAGPKVGPDLLVAKFFAGVRVFFDTSVFFDLNDLPDPQDLAQADYVNDILIGNPTEVPPDLDPDPDKERYASFDGRVRLSELDLITDADPAGIFNYSGALYAGLEAFSLIRRCWPVSS
jgi:hypothetical protein